MTMLEVLCIHGVDICPSLSCLVRLTRLELLLDLCCPRMAVPHSTLLMLQDWPQLRSLDLSWASPEPVMFGDTLTRLTQLEDVSLNLRDCSGLEQLPPHVTALSLQTSGVWTWQQCPVCSAAPACSASGLTAIQVCALIL